MTRHPYLLGMAIAVVTVALMLFVGIAFPRVASAAAANQAWVSFGFYTVALFGLTIYFWRDDANAIFWALIGAFLLLHVAGFVWLISVRGGVGPFGYPIIGPAEYAAVSLGIFCGMELGRRRRRGQHSAHRPWHP